MKRLTVLLCVLLCAMFCGFGCASDSEKGKWDEFWKDLHGDNMRMRNDFSGPRYTEDSASLRKDM